MEVAKQELDLMLQEEEVKGLPVLILANKQDLPDAASEADIMTALDLHNIKSR